MSCPGLHCPGCSGGQSLAILAAAVGALAVAYETVAIVAEYIIPIAAVVVACFALAVAASVWLERWSDRRGVAWGAARGIVSRADVILPPPVRAPAAFPAAGAPAIEQHVHYEIHYHQADRQQAPAIIEGNGHVQQREQLQPRRR